MLHASYFLSAAGLAEGFCQARSMIGVSDWCFLRQDFTTKNFGDGDRPDQLFCFSVQPYLCISKASHFGALVEQVASIPA